MKILMAASFADKCENHHRYSLSLLQNQRGT